MRFETFIFDRFGIDLTGTACIHQGERIYLANEATTALEGTQRRGMYIGKMVSIFGPKPSLDFVLLYGHLATKNVVTLDDVLIEELYFGNDIPLETASEGIVMVLDEKGRGAAIGFVNERGMQSLIPKQRQIVQLVEKEEIG